MSPSVSLAESPGARDTRTALIHAEQIRLLYSNANISTAVTLTATAILSSLQWAVISHRVVLIWASCMMVLSLARLALAQDFRAESPGPPQAGFWGTAFTVGAGLAGLGWGAAGIWLFPGADLTHQILLAFILGGMMLGGGSILAARLEAFLAFLIPAGLPASVHFALLGDDAHIAMGSLAVIFTFSVVISTWRIYRTVESALNLKFENQDLVRALKAENERTESLNQTLEFRVQDRTAELNQAVSLLRSEIAERKLAEVERARLEADLRHAQKLQAIGVLAGGVAHDFNNILTAIAGYTELAQELIPRSSEAAGHLDQVTKAAMRASDVVRGLLTFSRKAPNSPTLISAGHVVSEALELLRASIPPSIEFIQNIDSECGCLFADPGLIHQVVMNLCTNAYQAMDGGPGRLEVSLQATEIGAQSQTGVPEGSYICLAVRDTGPGIPQPIAERLFEPFFTTKGPGHGTGLGLSIVHGIVTGYNGAVRFANHPPHGATFSVYLPRVVAGPPADMPAFGPPPTGTERVLFVDDESAIAALGARMLQDLGYTVTAKTSGPEALHLFSAAPGLFDLVITDYMMPQMTGVEFISELRRMRGDVPVILISGFNEQVLTPEQARHLGVNEFIRKPFSADALAHSARRALDSVIKPARE